MEKIMHDFFDLVNRSTIYTLENLKNINTEVVEALQTSSSTPLIKALQMIELQKVIYAVGMFSIFEARLQEIFKDAKYAFDQAEKVLKEKDEFTLYEKFHDLRQAINVLKHGDGKSYDILLQKEQQLPFRIKKRDESFFCEGDISEVTSLIKVDDEFVKYCAEIIYEVSKVIYQE